MANPTHDFKIGVDWLTNEDGTVALANYIFVDYDNGSDATLDGFNPTTPYATLLAARAANTRTENYVVLSRAPVSSATIGEILNPAEAFADGNTVEIDFGGGQMFSTNFATMRGFVIKNASPVGVLARWVDCTFINCDTSQTSSNHYMINCTFVNCGTMTLSGASLSPDYISGCKFFNTPLTVNSASIRFDNCYGDAGSTISHTANFIMNTCNWRGTISGSGTPVITGNIDQDPKFNNDTLGDYTIQIDSPHLNLNIGNPLYSFDSQFQGQTELDAAVTANANLSYGANGSIINASGLDQNLDLAEVDFGVQKNLPIFRPSGNTNLSGVKLFIDMSLDGSTFTGYREFIWGTSPTYSNLTNPVLPVTDGDSYTNAELGNSGAQLNLIAVYKYKIRIVIPA